MKIVLAAVLTAIATAVMSVVGVAPATAAAPQVVCNNTLATALTGYHPKLQVIVEEGASCYIQDAVVFSVRAYNPENVYILGTSLQHGVHHNVMIRGATGNVVIGSAGCTYDPHVGNNIKIRNSNNVLICQMGVDNNISVKGSHGRVTIRQSVACDNIVASYNDPYDGPTGGHVNPDAIRLLRLQAANHIFAWGNSGRDVIERHTTEDFMSPSACRAMLRS